MFEVYVEQFFPPTMGGRGYSSVIRTFGGVTEAEAKAMVKVLDAEWKKQANDRYSFYVGYRAEKVVA